MEIKRGDVVCINLPQQGAHIQYGNRPCIVVQNNTGNRYSPLVIVVPVTSKLDKKNVPTHVYYTHENGSGDTVTNIVLCEQILTIPKDYITKVSAHCSDETIKQIDEKLKISLGLK